MVISVVYASSQVITARNTRETAQKKSGTVRFRSFIYKIIGNATGKDRMDYHLFRYIQNM